MYGYEYIKQQIDILMRITILSFNTLVFLQKNTTSSPSAPFSQEASTQTGVCTNIHALDSRYFQCSSFKTKTTTPNQPLESCVSLLRLHKCFTEASKVTGNFQADFFFFSCALTCKTTRFEPSLWSIYHHLPLVASEPEKNLQSGGSIFLLHTGEQRVSL